MDGVVWDCDQHHKKKTFYKTEEVNIIVSRDSLNIT